MNDAYDALTVVTVSDENGEQTWSPGGEESPSGRQKATCPDCGKSITITAAGAMRQHKCITDIPSGGKSGSQQVRKRARAPQSVRVLGVALLAEGIEFTAAMTVARYVPCSPSEVPADMGDHADTMVGPIIDGIWPQLPKGAQRTLKAIADESDLLAAFMGLYEYFSRLKTWAEQEQIKREDSSPPKRGYDDGQVSPEAYGSGPIGIVPFSPDSVGL